MIEQLVFDSPAQLTQQAAVRLQEKLAELIDQKVVNVLLTGGTLGIQILADLGKLNLNLQNVRFFFGDERYVPLGDKDRNEHQGLAVWPELAHNLVRYPDSDQPLEAALAEANSLFQARFGSISDASPVFDITILGMGPDGHVASLFPDHSHPKAWVVSENNSPKPPSQRLSLSFEALNRSKEVWFLVSGAAKADAVTDALGENGRLPASKVKGQSKTLWFMDQELRRAL